MTNRKDRHKESKPNRPCYDILQPLDSHPGKNNCADRKYAGPQEVTYSGNVRFSGVMDDLAAWVPGSW